MGSTGIAVKSILGLKAFPGDIHLNALNLSLEALHRGHLSGASPSRVYPQTSHTWIGPSLTSFPELTWSSAFHKAAYAFFQCHMPIQNFSAHPFLPGILPLPGIQDTFHQFQMSPLRWQVL